jgi:uncharacterized membrane protein YkoI
MRASAVRINRTIAAFFLTIGLTACAGMSEEKIALSEVPAVVTAAAEGAVDGLEIMSAEAEDKNGRTVYEIKGMADGVKHEIKIDANGMVLKVETDD